MNMNGAPSGSGIIGGMGGNMPNMPNMPNLPNIPGVPPNLKELLDISTRTTGQFRCNVCLQIFKGQHQLNQHRSTHRDGPCTLCGRMITSQENFLDHLQVFHPDKMTSTREQKPHRCTKCQKRFASVMELEEHSRKHPRRKQNQCEVCDHLCATAHDLKIHMRVHNDEKPYDCERCGKDFRSNGALFTHLRQVHHVDPFKCKKCGKSFRMARPAKAHEKECGL